MDFSYKCTKATIKTEVGTFDGGRVVLCDLEFEDEHGHTLTPVSDVLVVIGDGFADTEAYPENFLGDNPTEEELDQMEELCDNYPGYGVYNQEELYRMLQKS